MAVTAFAKGIKALEGQYNDGPAAGSTTCYRRAIVMRDASGNLKNGATAAGCFGVGVAGYNDGQWLAAGSTSTNPDVWDNSSGNAGDIRIKYDDGIYGPFANSATSITAGMEGDVCYIVDNVTVHATSNSGARSPAGMIYRVDSTGVYVQFDEMKVRLALVVGAASGTTFTQTYATANATVAAATATAPASATVIAQTALTDNGGGATADGTIAAISDTGGAADVGPVKDAVKELSTKINLLVTAVNALAADRAADVTQITALVADDLDNRQSINAIVDVLQAAGIAG